MRNLGQCSALMTTNLGPKGGFSSPMGCTDEVAFGSEVDAIFNSGGGCWQNPAWQQSCYLMQSRKSDQLQWDIINWARGDPPTILD